MSIFSFLMQRLIKSGCNIFDDRHLLRKVLTFLDKVLTNYNLWMWSMAMVLMLIHNSGIDPLDLELNNNFGFDPLFRIWFEFWVWYAILDLKISLCFGCDPWFWVSPLFLNFNISILLEMDELHFHWMRSIVILIFDPWFDRFQLSCKFHDTYYVNNIRFAV